jgi:hypothetical protein
MTSQYRHRRLSVAATPFPSPIEPGEIAVNTANRQLAVGDANSGSLGSALVLLAVRLFDARGIYAVGDYVVQAGAMYRCKTAHGPAAFNLANFDRVRDLGTAISAAEVTVMPAGTIGSTNVQAALSELDGDIGLKVGMAQLGEHAVLYDTDQVLTSTFTGMARRNIYAAPFDAAACMGIQVNGACEVAQEGTADLWVPTGLAYVGDQWAINSFGLDKSGGMKPSGFGGIAPTPPGLGNFVTSWNNEFGAAGVNDFWTIQQPIEGYRCARLAWGSVNAQPVTVCFWVLNKGYTGTFSGAVRNADGTRSYPFTYNIAAANTWEYKAISIPGDQLGVWDKTNGIGMYVHFTFMAGTNYKAPPHVWAAGSFLAGNGTFNAAPSATANYVAITGLLVLPGADTPSIPARSSFLQRPYDNELAICQRYFEIVGSGGNGYAQGSASISMAFRYATTKRARPTVAQTTTTPGIICAGGYLNASGAASVISAADNHNGFATTVTGFSALTVGQGVISNTPEWYKCNARM